MRGAILETLSRTRPRVRTPAAGLGLCLVLLSGCSSNPTPTSETIAPAAEIVARRPPTWPAHAAGQAAIAAALDQGCGLGLPVVASDDRGFGIVAVMSGGPENPAGCTLREQAGFYVAIAGGSARQPRLAADAFTFTQEGVPNNWKPGDPPGAWRDLMGVAPLGTMDVRAVVGDHVVQATLGGRLFILAWPSTTRPSLVLALDADGREIGRLDLKDLLGG